MTIYMCSIRKELNSTVCCVYVDDSINILSSATSKQINTRQDSQKIISYSNSNKTMVLVLLFLLLVFCSTLNLSHIRLLQKHGDLNKYLCNSDYPLLQDTQLHLSPNVNHILYYPNNTAFYLHEGQSVTLFASYSSHIMMFGVNINNYYGFAILLININNNITLNNINITSTSGSAQCSEKVLTSCGGSGLIYNRIEVLEVHVVVNKTVIKGNWNIVPYTDINIAAQVDGKEPKAISAFAAGMTVIFSIGNYTANVLLSHGDWDVDIGGV